MSNNYVSLHNHTYYSLMDSLIHPEELFVRAKELEQEAIAITDHGTLACAWKGLKNSKKHGVKLIIGEEFYFVNNFENDDKIRHIILLAKNYNGYKNLLLAHKLSFDNSIILFNRVIPRINWDILKQCSEGLICTTACGNGILSRLINNRQEDIAYKDAQKLKDIFGENLAIEIQPHNMRRNATSFNDYEDQSFVNRRLVILADKLNLKVVPTNNAHYLKKEDWEAHDVQLAVGNKVPVRAVSRLKYSVSDFYLKSRDEVVTFFNRAFPNRAEEFCDNTLFFANQCEFPGWIDPKYSNPSGKELPEFDILDKDEINNLNSWKNNQPDSIKELDNDKIYLRYLCENKLKSLISLNNVDQYKARVNEELDVIEYKGFSSYMLIVADYVNYCKKNGYPVGPGRGCLAGDTLVLTSNGYKRLDEIKSGEYVFTHTGKLRKVLNTFKFDVSNEELLKIKSERSFGELVLTKDHKIYSADNEDFHSGLCPDWNKAKDLNVHDFIFTPLNLERKIYKENLYIDLAKYTKLKYDDKFIYRKIFFKNDLSIREISRKTGLNFEFIREIKQKEYDIAENLSNIKNNHLNILKSYLLKLNLTIEEWREIKNYKLVIIKRFLEIDDDFMYLLGRWVGDGCFHGGKKRKGIHIAFNSKDIDGIQKITNYLNLIGITYYINSSKIFNSVGITITCDFFAKLFKKYFPKYKNSYTKSFPIFFRKLNNKLLSSLLSGLFDADGNFSSPNNRITTTSKILAMQIKELCVLLGIPSNVYKETNKYRYDVKTHDTFRIFYNLKNNDKHNKSFCRIKSIKTCYRKFVYDIMVEEDHSYLTASGIVHNSVGGSLIAYLLGIHTADPIQYGLIFARFLNKYKDAFPDVDLDFSSEGKKKVQEYISNKYGQEYVAHVSNLSTITPKVYARDIARALEFGGNHKAAVQFGNDIADSIPDDIASIKEALDKAPLFAAYADNEKYSALRKYAKYFDKIPRTWATHAGGIVIGKRKLHDIVPIRKDKEGTIAVEYDKYDTEDNGLVKMDILGLSTLDIIQNTIKTIKDNNKNIDLNNLIDYDKPHEDVYKLVAEGNTSCVFQLGGSAGTVELCKKVIPKNIEDLAIINALARPNAKDIRESFIVSKHSGKKAELLHENLDRAFSSTFGFALFEECLMYVAQDVAGWDMHDADKLRKLTKEKGKNPEKVAKWRDEFITGAVQNKGINKALATKIWDEIIDKFQGYAFNKSHAVLYSLISFQTAYLKKHYPLEFMVANLMFESNSNALKSEDNIIQIKREIRNSGVKILPPDINGSLLSYSILSDDNLLTGFEAIKYVSVDSIPKIIEQRPFYSFSDFIAKTHSFINSRTIQALAATGCLDSFGLTRRQMYLYAADYKKKIQLWLKKKNKSEEFQYPWPDDVEEWSASEKYALEVFYMGEAFGNTIKEAYGSFFDNKAINFSKLPSLFPEGTMQDFVPVDYGIIEGVITKYFEFKVKNENSKIFGQTMGRMELQDPYGNYINFTLFPSSMDRLKKRLKELTKNKIKLEPGVAIHCSGQANWYLGELSIIFDDLKKISAAPSLPTDLDHKAVKMRILNKKNDKNNDIDPDNLLGEVEDELIESGCEDLEEMS